MRSRSEQEKAEQLREQSQRFDVALSNMSQGLCMFDDAQRLIVCNNRYAEMYGLTGSRRGPAPPCGRSWSIGSPRAMRR